MLTIFILGLGLDLAGSVSSDQNPILQVFLCRMLKYLFDPVSSRSVRLNHFCPLTHSCPFLDIYQLGLQAASMLLSSIDSTVGNKIDETMKKSLQNVIGPVIATGRDFDWICQAILGSLCMQ